MVLRGLLDKKSAAGTWRPRAFELSDSTLAYEEVRQGKRVRATIAIAALGAAVVADGELLIAEHGAIRLHFCRAVENAGGPSLEDWRAALAAAIGARPLAPDYGAALCRRTRAPLRVRGPLLKKGGSRGSVAGLRAAGRRLSFGTRRNWSERTFSLDFAKGELAYRDDAGALKGVVKLTAKTTVATPASVSLRGRTAAALPDDAEPLYFEIADALDGDGAPRDHFAVRALAKRDFGEWILSIKECVASLQPSAAPPPPRVAGEDAYELSDEEFEMAVPRRLTDDPPPRERVSSFTAGAAPKLRGDLAAALAAGQSEAALQRREAALVAEREAELAAGQHAAELAAALESLAAPSEDAEEAAAARDSLAEPSEDAEDIAAARDSLAEPSQDAEDIAAAPSEEPGDAVPAEIRDCFVYYQDASGAQQGPATWTEFRAAYDAGETHDNCLVFAHGVVDAWAAIGETLFKDLLAPRPPPPPPAD